MRLAERDGLQLWSYPDGIDDGGIIHINKAKALVMGPEPRLVYTVVCPDGWHNPHGTGSLEGYNVDCYFDGNEEFLGPDEFGVEPTWRPASREWSVRNTFEIFGDPACTRHSSEEEAEAAATQMARSIAEGAYPSGLVEYEPPGQTGIVHEIEWAKELADEAGASEEKPGSLCLTRIAMHIRQSAVKVDWQWRNL